MVGGVSVEVMVAVISALAAFAAVGVSLLRLPVERRKARADAAASITSAASELVEELRCELCRLRERIEALETLTDAQTAEIERLQAQVEVLQAENARLTRENKELARRTSGLPAVPEVVGEKPDRSKPDLSG